MAAYLVTHSLLSSWLHLIRENPYEDLTTEGDPLAEFMLVLRREPTPRTEAIHVVGNGKAIDKGRSFRIENATVMLIFGNINSDTDHFIPPLYYSMLLRTTDFFALVTSF